MKKTRKIVHKSHSKRHIKHKKKEENSTIVFIAIAAIIVLTLFIINVDKFIPQNTSSGNEKIYAKVNGIPITAKSVDEKYDKIPEEYRSIISKEMVLNQSIYEILFKEELKKKGMSITDKEISDLINKRLASIKESIGEEEFQKQLDAQKKTVEELIEENYDAFEMELITQKIQDQFASDDQIRKYYDDNIDKFKVGEMYESRHILICFNGSTGCTANYTESEALTKIKDIRKQIIDGADFAQMAKEYSTGPSANSGGYLGPAGKGQFVKSFEDALFALDIGEVSQPVKTEFGWHIIKLLNKTPAKTLDFEDIKSQVKSAVLLEKQQEIADYYRNLWNNADIEIYFTNTDNEYQNIGAASSSSCIAKYGVSADTVLFYHATWCPHCKRMEPVVSDFEKQGYKFKWIDSDNAEESKVIKDCFPDQYQKGVPQFICAGSGELIMGETKVLKDLLDKCK